jgi:Fe-S-cluster containining protein
MLLINKIKAVKRLFRQVDKHVASFKKKSNLACLPICGECCTKRDIEATILEFLPAAYHLFLTQRYQNILEQLEKKSDSICVFYNPLATDGRCSNYENRGLICRLFGFSTKTDKNSQKMLITCKKVKILFEPIKLEKFIKKAPELTICYIKLYGIHPQLAVKYLPINDAIRKALDTVLLHYQYRKKIA